MQEYSSISVSSYEAGALADRLSEQSSDGWSVVAIVPTGSTVTAYLSRPTDAAPLAADDATDPPDVADTADTTDIVAAAGAAAAADAISTDDGTATEADAPTEPADAAAGWAAGGAAAAAGGTEAVADAADTIASTDTVDTTAAADVTASDTAAAAETSTTAAATDGAAPAGWYADPSSRFELRYWDGGQWTEHVSRAGQQYTDPPVA
jgi:hypothetical protein